MEWLWEHATRANIGALAGLASAGAWIRSAMVSTDAYLRLNVLNGARPDTVAAIKLQARWNAIAASLSAVAAIMGAWLLWKP